LDDAVLVLPDDVFEVQHTPSIILQGPKLSENKLRRSQSRLDSDKTTGPTAIAD
jgi:hypothetical protein